MQVNLFVMRQLARRGCQAAWSTSELFLPRVEHFHSAAAHAAAERHGQLATANHGFRIHVLTQERFGRYIATRIFAEDAGSACSLAEIHNGCCDADRSELASTRGMLITQMLVDEQLFSSMPTRWRVPRAGSREPGAGSRECACQRPRKDWPLRHIEKSRTSGTFDHAIANPVLA